MTLADFETLVLTQQPASVPWEPVTDYSFEARKAIEGEHPKLIQQVFQPKRVLDAGCGPGHLVRMLHELGGMMVKGFDVRCESSASTATPRFYRADVASRYLQPSRFGAKADLVICREVLEHLTLRHLRNAVINLCALSKRFVYLTTRFSSEHDITHVETSDELDPTHITIPSKDLLRILFVLEGFKRRADLEAQMDWQQKGRVLVYERAA